MKNVERILKTLVLLFLFPAIGLAVGIPQGTKADDNQFWQQFRQALLINDQKQVVMMTRFPFEVRGVDDSIPVRRYNRSKFNNVLRKIVSQPVLLPSGGRFVEKTVLEVVKEKPELSEKDYLTPDFVRVEQFEFQRLNGHLIFTGAYLEE